MENQKFKESYYFAGLIRRKIQQQFLSPQEEEALNAWCQKSAANRAFYERMLDEEYLTQSVKRYLSTDTNHRWQEFQTKHLHKKRSKVSLKLIWSAAAILLLSGIGLWMTIGRMPYSVSEKVITRIDDIMPGGNLATLTIDGKGPIELDASQSGVIARGEEVVYYDGTHISGSKDDDEKNTPKHLQEVYYTLKTPIGGTYQATLSDGSRVWLNANSTLRYPASFSEKERVVEVTGEVYFEVSKKGYHPFRVRSKAQDIVVLGTEFNVNAYKDEIKTTLVDGRVQVRNLQSNLTYNLVPGEQSIVRSKETGIERINTEQYVSWKDGYFYFNKTPFKDVMEQLALWYNVEVVYRGKVPQETFSGEMGRDLTLGEALRLLNMSAIQIHLRDGRKLVVN
ncbi:FecR family protein [Sphingobacterium paucimobilis]|nr:FecR family protein [Sphingobacterium paucimobilis]